MRLRLRRHLLVRRTPQGVLAGLLAAGLLLGGCRLPGTSSSVHLASSWKGVGLLAVVAQDRRIVLVGINPRAGWIRPLAVLPGLLGAEPNAQATAQAVIDRLPSQASARAAVLVTVNTGGSLREVVRVPFGAKRGVVVGHLGNFWFPFVWHRQLVSLGIPGRAASVQVHRANLGRRLSNGTSSTLAMVPVAADGACVVGQPSFNTLSGVTWIANAATAASPRVVMTPGTPGGIACSTTGALISVTASGSGSTETTAPPTPGNTVLVVRPGTGTPEKVTVGRDPQQVAWDGPQTAVVAITGAAGPALQVVNLLTRHVVHHMSLPGMTPIAMLCVTSGKMVALGGSRAVIASTTAAAARSVALPGFNLTTGRCVPGNAPAAR